MNEPKSRREFLADVGKGTLLATLGPALAGEFGISSASAAETPAALNFGDMESLVCFMQETPVSKLQPALAAKLKAGVSLKQRAHLRWRGLHRLSYADGAEPRIEDG